MVEEPSRPTPARAPGIAESSDAMQALEGRLARLEQSLSEARNDIAGAHAARDDARAETTRTRAELERLSSELARATEEASALSARLETEREERIAAVEGARARNDLAIEALQKRLEESKLAPVAVPVHTGGDLAARPAPEGQSAVRKELPAPVSPVFRIPQREPERPSVLRGFLIKGLILAAVGGTVVATQRQAVGRVADRLMNLPKSAATDSGLADAVNVVRADFVDKPLPAPSQFVAYLKSRAVANRENAGVDGWGTEFRLDVSPSAIRSAGPDRTFDTPDDRAIELEAPK